MYMYVCMYIYIYILISLSNLLCCPWFSSRYMTLGSLPRRSQIYLSVVEVKRMMRNVSLSQGCVMMILRIIYSSCTFGFSISFFRWRFLTLWIAHLLSTSAWCGRTKSPTVIVKKLIRNRSSPWWWWGSCCRALCPTTILFRTVKS